MAIGTKSIQAGGETFTPVLGDPIVNETPSGVLDGTNRTFVISLAPQAGTVMVFLDGMLMKPGAGNDYTISGATITWEYDIGSCPTAQMLVWYLKEGESINVWNPIITTATVTAERNDAVFCDTTAIGPFTVLLPASPEIGDVVRVINLNNSFETNNLTIGRNSSNIMGLAEDLIVDENISFDLMYSNASQGWTIM